MAYFKLAQAKNYLNITTGTDDVLLDELIVRAQKAIETHCGRQFEASAAVARYYSVPIGEGNEVWIDGVLRTSKGARTLYLDEDLLTISANGLVNGDGTAISSSNYDLLPKNLTPKYAIRLKQSSLVAWEGQTDGDTEDVIAVTGTWGYSTTAPADIVHACLRLVGFYFKQKDAQVFDVTAIPDAGVITIPQGIPADVKLILAPYVRRV